MADATVSAGQVTTYTFVPSLKIVAAHAFAIADRLEDFEDVLKKCVTDVVIPSIATNFDVGGRPPWAPWNESTIEFRQMLGTEAQSLLVKSGALRDTMHDVGIWTISKTEAYIADLPDDVWYGKIHQGGYPGGGNAGPIPARPFDVLQPEDEEEIGKLFDEWLEKQIEEGWPG